MHTILIAADNRKIKGNISQDPNMASTLNNDCLMLIIFSINFPTSWFLGKRSIYHLYICIIYKNNKSQNEVFLIHTFHFLIMIIMA